jgi:hypothetical protein
MSNLEALHRRAKALNLHGLLAHWEEAAAAGWLATLIDWEEQERTRRSLERRLWKPGWPVGCYAHAICPAAIPSR